MSVLCFFFFFKQKTAYEMRISDWSSDVCSSDLAGERARTAGELAIYVFYVAVATFSIVLAAWAPRYAPQWIGVAGVVYALLSLTGVVESLARRRALARHAS